MPGDNAKQHETARGPRLEWQRELDATMAAIDSRLIHPRRRATDAGPPPALPGVGEVHLTTEILDEIAWRVAEQMRRHALAFPTAEPDLTPAAAAPLVEEAALRPGKMLMIRYRMPRLPWPLRLLQRRRRRKQHPLTTVKVSP
jgi:hypothetical protein